MSRVARTLLPTIRTDTIPRVSTVACRVTRIVQDISFQRIGIMLIMLTTIILTVLIGIGLIFSGTLNKADSRIKGGSTLLLYGMAIFVCAVGRMFDETPLGLPDVFGVLFIGGLVIHRLGKDRGWDAPTERLLPGSWDAATFVALGVLSVVSRIVMPTPWRPLADSAWVALIVGGVVGSLWHRHKNHNPAT